MTWIRYVCIMPRCLVEEQSDMTATKKYVQRPSSTLNNHPHQLHLVSSQRKFVNWWFETISGQESCDTICAECWLKKRNSSALSHICRLGCGGDCGQNGSCAFGRKCTQNTGIRCISYVGKYGDILRSLFWPRFRAPDSLGLKSQGEWSKVTKDFQKLVYVNIRYR